MGRSLSHGVSSGFQCKALFGTEGRADPQLGTEVRSRGTRGPSLEEMAEVLQREFADVYVTANYIEVRAPRREG